MTNRFKEVMGKMYILTDEDRAFVEWFGSPGKPMELQEFLDFWNSMSPWQQYACQVEYRGY